MWRKWEFVINSISPESRGSTELNGRAFHGRRVVESFRRNAIGETEGSNYNTYVVGGRQVSPASTIEELEGSRRV
jgi:hypothetical protein